MTSQPKELNNSADLTQLKTEFSFFKKTKQTTRDIRIFTNSHAFTDSQRRHYKEITQVAVTVSDLPLPIQHEVRPDSTPSLTLPVIYVAPGSRVYLRTQQGMKVLTVGVGEGGR